MMKEIVFRFGPMGSSKTAQALMQKYDCEQKGQNVLLLKPIVDTRDGDMIVSRVGLASECRFVEDFISREGKCYQEDFEGYQVIIVDEAQFLVPEQVRALSKLVDNPWLDAKVFCYGLRTDFRGELFPGSAALLACADRIEEIESVCWCGKKATHNARFNESGIVICGEQFLLGGNEGYVSLCRKHFHAGILKGDEKNEAAG